MRQDKSGKDWKEEVGCSRNDTKFARVETGNGTRTGSGKKWAGSSCAGAFVQQQILVEGSSGGSGTIMEARNIITTTWRKAAAFLYVIYRRHVCRLRGGRFSWGEGVYCPIPFRFVQAGDVDGKSGG